MKKYFGILLISLLIIGCSNNYTKVAQFEEEVPETVKQIGSMMHVSNMSAAKFETGNDTLSVYFGELMQYDNPGYWIALYEHDEFAQFETITPAEVQAGKDICIKYQNSSKKVELLVQSVDKEGCVNYVWLCDGSHSKSICVQKINKTLEVGKALPNLKLFSINGQIITTDNYHGKYLVINWWSIFCIPCRQEITGLNKLTDQYLTNDEIAFLAICDNSSNELKTFLDKNEFKFVQTVANEEIIKIFGKSYPKNLIVSPEGEILYYNEGASEHTPKEIADKVKELLS